MPSGRRSLRDLERLRTRGLKLAGAGGVRVLAPSEVESRRRETTNLLRPHWFDQGREC